MSEEALGQVLSPLRKSQRTIISLVVQAMATLGQAASIPIAAVLAQRVGSQVDSALTRVYRLLHNRRLDDLVLSCRRQSKGSQKRQRWYRAGNA